MLISLANFKQFLQFDKDFRGHLTINLSFHLDWFQTVRAFMLMSILLVLISFGYSIKQIYQIPIIKHRNQKDSVSLVLPALLMFVGGLNIYFPIMFC